MMKSIRGIFRNGQLELLETPPAILDGEVIVTFLTPEDVDLTERGINEVQAADLRQRLSTFAEDWEHPAMDSYDAL